MSFLYRRLVRPTLFEWDSETAHERTLHVLGWISRRELLRDALASFFEVRPLPVKLFGLTFPNPVGVAAGMDKHALAVPAWSALGFGFCELGGVTWQSQEGNPRPRLFRVLPEEALINRMGFNNPGAETFAAALAQWRASGFWPKHPVGINLGKSKAAPLADAADDYAASFKTLWPWADFFVVNVSSPNTPGLRQLQNRSALQEILSALQQANEASARTSRGTSGSSRSEAKTDSKQPGHESNAPPRLVSDRAVPADGSKPILIKVDPDLAWETLDEVLEVAIQHKTAGVVATNTTLTRPDSSRPGAGEAYRETGGLSGRPLRHRSTEVIRHIHRQTRGKLPIIGVGGIFDAQDAWEKITAGASLIQVYTGLIYQGPSIVRDIVAGLRERLAAAGWMSVGEAAGTAQRT